MILVGTSMYGEPRRPIRTSECKKQNQQDMNLQIAALHVLSTAVSGARAIATHPDDTNSKLQLESALVNSFIGFMAAVMKTIPMEVYDAFGNAINTDKIVHSIEKRLAKVSLEKCVSFIAHDVRLQIDQQV